jgi:hypothetical protein
MPSLSTGGLGPRVARLVESRAGCVRIIVEVQDLQLSTYGDGWRAPLVP